jgi:ferredoxin
MREKAVINHRLCRECGNCLEVCVASAIYEEVKEPQFIRIKRQAQASAQGKEVSEMPFGRGRGGLGMGRGMGLGRGMGYGRGFGMGRGNPYPFCRFYPWLPRRWWAYGSG